MTVHILPLWNHWVFLRGSGWVPGGRLHGLISTVLPPWCSNNTSASLWRGWYFYACQLFTFAFATATCAVGVCKEQKTCRTLVPSLCGLQNRAEHEELLWATEGWEQRAGTHGLQVSSMRTEVSFHCNFCSASHLSGLTLKYLVVGRQSLATDACRVLANGCSFQGATFESCFSPYPLDPVLLHWSVRDQDEKQEKQGGNADSFFYRQ